MCMLTLKVSLYINCVCSNKHLISSYAWNVVNIPWNCSRPKARHNEQKHPLVGIVWEIYSLQFTACSLGGSREVGDGCNFITRFLGRWAAILQLVHIQCTGTRSCTWIVTFLIIHFCLFTHLTCTPFIFILQGRIQSAQNGGGGGLKEYIGSKCFKN